LDILQAQADALKHWLTAEGYTQIECEVPIQKREASGVEFNGIIDLLATGDGKILILDHKSGGGSFAGYFAQLEAYRASIAERDRSIQLDVAIHWLDRREIAVVT
jgi:ATP-dependent exoDNAse (exonuclease V) beta subunit